VAAARLARCRESVNRLATAHALPPENLLAPDAVRRLAWTPPEPAELDEVSAALKHYGARPWQIELTAADLTKALPTPHSY
jgi:ribonuclease D